MFLDNKRQKGHRRITHDLQEIAFAAGCIDDLSGSGS